MRYEHMQRSYLASRSGAAVWAECYKGEAGASRGGVAFMHCAPRVSLDQTKGDILDDFWSMWNRFKASNPGLSALVLDARTGLPMEVPTFHLCIRELALDAATVTPDSAQFLTSKSLRLMQVTLADIRGAGYAERRAIGNREISAGVSHAYDDKAVAPSEYQGNSEQSAVFTPKCCSGGSCRAYSAKGAAEPGATWVGGAQGAEQ